LIQVKSAASARCDLLSGRPEIGSINGICKTAIKTVAGRVAVLRLNCVRSGIRGKK